MTVLGDLFPCVLGGGAWLEGLSGLCLNVVVPFVCFVF